MVDVTPTPNFGLGINPEFSNGVGYANDTFSPNSVNNPLNPTNAAENSATPLERFGPAANSNNANAPSSSTTSNPAFNQNALSLASQAAQHSGLAGNTLGTLTSDINNIGSSWFGFSPGTSSIASAANPASSSGALGQIAGFFNTADTSVAAASDAAANALGTGTFVNAAGDSVAAGTPGAIELTGNQAASLAASGAASPGFLGGITLSGALTAAGLGAVGGGMLASALGENPTGGSIGGGIGAVAGFAVGGPIGAVVGGIGGSLFGGMFGNNTPPTSDTTTTSNISSTGGLQNTTTASKNPSSGTDAFTASAQENFASIAGAANTALGIQFNPEVQFVGGDSTRHGGPFIGVSDSKTGQDTGAIYFNPQDPASTQQAYAQALSAAASFSGYQDTSKLTDWYNNTYVNSNNGATNIAPSLPNNPNANQSASTWNNFITQYAANQNANAAPTQTTVGGKPVTSYQIQGTTNANASPAPAAA